MTSKEQIIQAAHKVFKRFGFNKASMSDIAGESRKGRRTIYTHFKGKEDVFVAVIDAEVQKLSDKLSELIQKPILPKEKLRKYMIIRMKALRDLTVYYEALRQDIAGNLGFMENLRKEYDKMEINMIKSILDEGNATNHFKIEDTQLVAEAILLATKGFELPIFMGKTDYNLNRLINPLIDLLYDGIEKKPDPPEPLNLNP